MTLTLNLADWLALLTHFLSLSLLAIGGAITTAPDMHRFLVEQRHWLSDSQFTSSIALAQAAPGPNVLFIALLGWNVGMNAGGGVAGGGVAWAYGALGVGIAMIGILLPSTTLTFAATRWAHQNRDLRAVRAFKQGMAPVVIALLMSTGWILSASHDPSQNQGRLWLVSGVSALLVWRTRLHLLWILAAGGLLGWFGWV
ncbi:MAG: chromate transporter [Rhodoferax sp.]|uniref:chromate transporter n=1 Tax=Rhodoferax sp. TaxID=50421 RepID=UPI003018CF9B